MKIKVDEVATLTKWWETESEYPVITVKSMCRDFECTPEELFNSLRDYLMYNLQFPDRALVVFSTLFGQEKSS